MASIRTEQSTDLAAIRQVNIAAFGSAHEANLVDCLRSSIEILSLVAVELDRIVGHICFSPITIAGESDRDLNLLGLAPLAVLPDYQRQGIGSLLVRQGLAECTRLGCQAVFVLGNPAYYGRFGFTPARHPGLQCEFLVPDDAFMVLELVGGGLNDRAGTVKYAAAFDRFKSQLN